MLQLNERDEVRQSFGVSDEQVLRDYAISHILAAISSNEQLNDCLLFFGGTALNRTVLNSRLSEDIDLLVLEGKRSQLGELLIKTIEPVLRRTIGPVRWVTQFGRKPVDPAQLLLRGSTPVKLQLLTTDFFTGWPFKPTTVHQRYADAPPANLFVPQAESFAGWKTASWYERHAPRDLYDLSELAKAGYVNSQAAELFERFGPTGATPQSWMFEKAPSESEWQIELSHQTILQITAQEALRTVKTAWSKTVRASESYD
jgi:predicted nucleotidyltransferase component of viral defense system